jgi:hypothetical protein
VLFLVISWKNKVVPRVSPRPCETSFRCFTGARAFWWLLIVFFKKEVIKMEKLRFYTSTGFDDEDEMPIIKKSAPPKPEVPNQDGIGAKKQEPVIAWRC